MYGKCKGYGVWCHFQQYFIYIMVVTSSCMVVKMLKQ
jgi:hypothetical protein